MLFFLGRGRDDATVGEVWGKVLGSSGLVRAVSLGYPQGTGKPVVFRVWSKCSGPANSLVSITTSCSGCSPAPNPEQPDRLRSAEVSRVMSGVKRCERGHALSCKQSSPGFEGARGKPDTQVLRLLSENSELYGGRNGQHHLQQTSLILMGKRQREEGLEAMLTAA